MLYLPNLQTPSPCAKQDLSSLELLPSNLGGVSADVFVMPLRLTFAAVGLRCAKLQAIVAFLAFVIDMQDIAGDPGGVLWAVV